MHEGTPKPANPKKEGAGPLQDRSASKGGGKHGGGAFSQEDFEDDDDVVLMAEQSPRGEENDHVMKGEDGFLVEWALGALLFAAFESPSPGNLEHCGGENEDDPADLLYPKEEE